MRLTMMTAAMIVAIATTAGCKGKPDDLTITNAYVRLPAVPRQPAALYFTITGGATDDTLVSVTAENAIRAELHESMTGTGGMTRMAPLAAVKVPAHTKVEFAPGGLHVMLFDVNPAIKPPRTMMINFVFKSAAHYTISAVTRNAGG